METQVQIPATPMESCKEGLNEGYYRDHVRTRNMEFLSWMVTDMTESLAYLKRMMIG